MKFGIGQNVLRIEDHRLITGQGTYADDITTDLHAAFVRSPYAHARIDAIDISAAQAAPGVKAVYTYADWDAAGLRGLPIRTQLKNIDGSDLHVPERLPLCRDIVRHVGDCVAVVIAESRALARDGADLVDVDYSELPVASTVAQAKSPDAQQLHPDRPNNICMDWHVGDATGTDAAFEQAAHITRLDLVNNRVVAAAMENRAAVALYDHQSQTLTLTGSIQNVFTHRGLALQTFGWDKDYLHAKADDIGGGFGCKNQFQPEHAMCLFAADRLKQSVKWIGDRTECFTTDSHGRAVESHVEVAFDAKHCITGLRVRSYANIGAYCSTNGPLVPTLATGVVLGGAYAFKNAYMHVTGYYTNTAPTDAYRGAGRPEATYLIERTLDKAAIELGLDPIELRQINLVKPSQMPWTTAMGRTIESGNFPAVFDQALERSAYHGYEVRKAGSAAKGLLRGFGCAFYMECTLGVPEEYSRIEMTPEGHVTLFVGTQSAGLGHQTSFSQIIADRLKIPLENISYVHADTTQMPQGGGHGGSRSIQIGGSSTFMTAGKIEQKLKEIAGHLLEAAAEDIELEETVVRITGTDRTMPRDAITRAAFDPDQLPQGMEIGLTDATVYQRENNTYPNGCHCLEVELDPETGRFAIDRYTVVDDFGRLVNPMIVQGQIMGGLVQGMGQAGLEHVVFDPTNGQLLSGSFMDYTMPRADDTPEYVDISFYEEAPDPNNPLGVKGCGEAGAIGSAPALVNAMVNALHDYGVDHLDMPILPETVWRIVQNKATT